MAKKTVPVEKTKRTFQAIKKLVAPTAAATATTVAAPDEAEATRALPSRSSAMKIIERMTKGTGKLEPEKLMSDVINPMGLDGYDTKRVLSDLLGSAVIESSPQNMTRADDMIRQAYPHLNLRQTPIKISREIETPKGNILNLDELKASGAYLPNPKDPLSSPIYINPRMAKDPETLVSVGFHEGEHSVRDFTNLSGMGEQSIEAFTKKAKDAAKKQIADRNRDLSIFAKTDEEIQAIDPLFGISKNTFKHHEKYPINFELEKLTERVNQGVVTPSMEELKKLHLLRYGNKAAAITPVGGISSEDIDPIGLAQDLYKGYNEHVAAPITSAIKQKLLPKFKAGNKEYETTSEVAEAVADMGFDPLNWAGPIGEILSAGQLVEMLPEKQNRKFRIFDKKPANEVPTELNQQPIQLINK